MKFGTNVAVLIGRLTRDPEISTDKKGGTIADFGLAVNDGVDRDGKDYTSFFNCRAFGKTAEFIRDYVRKGCLVGIAGKNRQERWEKDGVKHSNYRVIVNTLEKLTYDKAESTQAETKSDDSSQSYDTPEQQADNACNDEQQDPQF